MNGLLAGTIFNGNVINNRFATQTLNDIELLLSNNICDETTTYIEKRVILGYNYGEISNILNFTHYITLNDARLSDYRQQYAFVLPIETSLILQDESQCGTQVEINGTMAVKLADTSVNDCRNGGQKILEVETDGDVYYSIFKTDINGTGYPLNLCVNSGILWQIPIKIYGIYSQSKSQNLFSYQMKSKYFRGEGNLIDTNFKSQVAIETDGEEEQFEDTKGYGTTGKFVPENNFSYPVFIVGEDDTNVRALSPVYDYSNVLALVKFGILERKEVEETVDETTGETTYNVLEPTKEYKFGIAVKKGHFYLDNYKYTLRGVCKVDEVNTIDVREETLLRPEQFIFATITENVYKILKSKFVFAGTILSGFLKQVINNTEITAVDYTGLRHICGIKTEDLKNAETEWYTYIWNANMPKDESGNPYTANAENGGIVYDLDDNSNPAYYDYLEFTYEKNQTIEPMVCAVGTTLGFKFLGWTENQPNRNGPFVIFSGDNLKATDSRVYFGNWDIP